MERRLRLLPTLRHFLILLKSPLSPMSRHRRCQSSRVPEPKYTSNWRTMGGALFFFPILKICLGGLLLWWL